MTIANSSPSDTKLDFVALKTARVKVKCSFV